MNLIAITILLCEAASTFVLGGTLGTPPLQYNTTIVGGYNASIENFPYQVALYIDGGFFCGGSIISNRFILTAAHCLTGKLAKNSVLHVGSTWRENGTVIPVAELIPHPLYPGTAIDVGLIKTKNPINFTPVIKSIKLPSKNRSLKDDSIITVSGWGKTGAYGPASKRLLAVDVPVVNFDKCQLIYNNKVSKYNFCAGGLPSGGKGTCFGDSGGPAVQDGVVVGIVSKGVPCAKANKPDMYTNVAHPDVREFITKHTGL